jgi:hypothetical protein
MCYFAGQRIASVLGIPIDGRRKTMSARRLLLFLVLPALLLLAGGCSREATAPEDEDLQGLELPPALSMKLDLEAFRMGTSTANRKMPAPLGQATKMNWTNAALRVLIINTTMGVILTPPYLAFSAAIHTIPSLQPDGSFLWIYTWVESENHEVQIRLRGKVEEDHVRWELRLTDPQATPPLDQALWFWGESAFDNQSGFWVFQDIEDADLPEIMRLDWEVVAEDDRYLAIQNIRQGVEGYGDTLTYRIDGTTASITFYDASEDVTADITWDTVTGAGSLQVPDYNNGERACWDENHDDVECPEEG